MDLTDPWTDADMMSVFSYLYLHEATSIPNSWAETMARFNGELEEATLATSSLVQQYNSLVVS